MSYLIQNRYVFVTCLVSLFFFNTAYAIVPDSALSQSNQTAESGILPQNLPPFSTKGSVWVDSVFNSLSSEERIAQLFMVAAYSNKGSVHANEIEALIRDYKIGGLIFFKGGPARQAKLTNRYQSVSKTPLLISIDAEWGLAMRLDSTIKYPRQMTLGAVQDEELIYRMGADIAAQCKRLGIHVNLAPVVDVNNNPDNPVISSRSFGEDKFNVASKGLAYMKGMQDHNVLACAKHFPGHGDTGSDSHYTLPVINHSKERLNALELYPFRELIQGGIGSIMVAHLFIPALDSNKNTASTLSKAIVTGLLKEEMNFKGLIFTDALNMKSVSAYYKPGEVDLKALLAGNDVLLFAEDVPAAIAAINKAVAAGKITQEEIDERSKKILAAKQWVGLDRYQPLNLKNLYSDLNSPEYELLNRYLVESSITLLHNDYRIIPLQRLDTLRIASVAIGGKAGNDFQATLGKYAPVTTFLIGKSIPKERRATLMKKLAKFNLVIVSVHGTNERPGKNFGITQETINFVNELSKNKKVILDLFANPYCLGKFYGAENTEAIVMSYQDSELAQQYSAQLIFGGIAAKGKLPVTASPLYRLGAGVETLPLNRFKYTIPEEFGIASADLQSIDDIALNGIKEQAYPGCQVMVVKEGKVIYQKSFGYHTYENKRKVRNDDLYDLASITKIGATLPALMKLQDEGSVHIDGNLCDYIPELVDTTDYMNVNIREMLAHQAGLVSWIPFYLKTMHKGEPKFSVYSMARSKLYPDRVAGNFFIHKDYKDVIMQRILSTRLKNKGEYKYSDLGYYLLKYIIEKQTGKPLNEYVAENFYSSLGLATTTYKPREKFKLEKIPPTEYDMLFRRQLVHGDVHDPGAAMQGGVGGHAGLFSSANDLAKILQLYLNWGEYGGVRYIEESTVKDFANCQFCDNDNRRGAGFDKPVRDGGSGPTCNCISFDSFGHTGFTGTLAWADPDEKIVYVFLSNRVYPDASNKKLIKMGIRTSIMRVIYEAIAASKKKQVN